MVLFLLHILCNEGLSLAIGLIGMTTLYFNRTKIKKKSTASTRVIGKRYYFDSNSFLILFLKMRRFFDSLVLQDIHK